MTQERGDKTREDVCKIADELIKEGIKPSINKIAQRLGHGSNTTIGQGLELWWQQLPERLDISEQSSELPKFLLETIKQLWSNALQEAALQWEAEKQNYIEQSKALEENITQQTSTIETLEQQLANLQQKLAQTETSLDNIIKDKEKEKTLFTEQYDQLSKKLEQAQQSLNQAQQNALNLHESYEKLQQSKIEEINTLTLEYTKKIALLEEKHTHLLEKLSLKQKAELEELTQSHLLLQQEKEDIQTELKTLYQTYQNIQQENNKNQEIIQAQKQELSESTEKNNKYQIIIDSQQKTIEAVQLDNAHLQVKLDTLNQQLQQQEKLRTQLETISQQLALFHIYKDQSENKQ